jgi:hypothetical protein
VRNSTVTGNSVSSLNGAGGGIRPFGGGNLNLGNTIVAGNSAATQPELSPIDGATITSAGNNHIGDSNGDSIVAGVVYQASDIRDISPLLGGLADNGGAVPTHALLPGSPAINTGDNANAVDPFTNSPLLFDARGTGFSRISDAIVDKGAFEVQSTPIPTPSPTPNPTPTPAPTPTPTPNPTPTPTPQTCAPLTTVSEGDLFPGGIVSFGVASGSGTVTVDHVNAGTGLQSLTVVGAPTNAVVNIPPFVPGTFAPVVVTFTTPNPALPTSFRLRAASQFHAIFIDVRCGTVTPTPTPTPVASPTPTPVATPTPTPATACPTFTSTVPIIIPAGAPGTTTGPASPYPSTVNVAFLGGTVTKLTVTLNNLSHTFPGDLDILLVGPGGQSVILMSDTGGGLDIVNVNLTFDDAAANSLPDSTQIISGFFKPTRL